MFTRTLCIVGLLALCSVQTSRAIDLSTAVYDKFETLLPPHLPEHDIRCFANETEYYKHLHDVPQRVVLPLEFGVDDSGVPINHATVWATCSMCYHAMIRLHTAVADMLNTSFPDSAERNFTTDPIPDEQWLTTLKQGCKSFVQTHYLLNGFNYQPGYRTLDGEFRQYLPCNISNTAGPKWKRDSPGFFKHKVDVCDKILANKVVSVNWSHMPLMEVAGVAQAVCNLNDDYLCHSHGKDEQAAIKRTQDHFRKLREQELEEFYAKQDKLRAERKARAAGRKSHRQAVLMAAEDAAETRAYFEAKMVEQLDKAKMIYEYNIENEKDEEKLEFYKSEYEAERSALIKEFEELEEKLDRMWRSAATQEREFKGEL